MSASGHPSEARALLPLTLTAIGVVYGDIGTSPLYAMRECFFGSHSVDATPDNVLGVLSLIVYSLLLVISIKYIAIVMRADNQGEGGILALTALLPQRLRTGPRLSALLLMGIFGAALLYGDGMITPAITVLGAVEGLNVATPLFEPYMGALRALFADVPFNPPHTPIYCCSTGELFPTDPDAMRTLAVNHWVAPVEFTRMIESMYRDGVRLFVECGPRGNLSAFVEDILRGKPFAAIPANVPRKGGPAIRHSGHHRRAPATRHIQADRHQQDSRKQDQRNGHKGQ